METIQEQVEAGNTERLPEMLKARQKFRDVLWNDMKSQRKAIHHQHIHTREQPSKHLTQILKQASNRTNIQALKDNNGLLCEGRSMRENAIQYWAGISRYTNGNLEETAAIQDQILMTIGDANRLNSPDSDVLNDPITEDEILDALKHIARGKAPGLDGIPVEIYCKLASSIAPYMAKLYNAILYYKQKPKAFTDGVITMIHKSGDRTQCGNYRPITLLNTDYRILAKVLATRFKQISGKIIDEEQAAFVPHRQIGDNVRLLQFIPWLLKSMGRTTGVLFCDFIKAYDTVDRQFLRKTLERLRVGERFLQWYDVLYSDTQACVRIDGHLSSLQPFQTGVRQGCPLAPFLYLCITQALLSYLKQHYSGIVVQHNKLIGVCFADDAEIFIENPSQAQHVISLLIEFGKASGQRIHLGKSRIVPVGAKCLSWAELVDKELHGIQVKSQASALGFTFHAWTEDISVDYNGIIKTVQNTYRKLIRLKLSAMGRGIAGQTYGTARFLYAAEFAEMDHNTTQLINAWTQALVDNGVTPMENRHKFKGLDFKTCSTYPSKGGFGNIDWKLQTLARQVKWTHRLLQDTYRIPWIWVGRLYLSLTNFPILTLILNVPTWKHHYMNHLPKPFQRVLSGMLTMPTPSWRTDFNMEFPNLWCTTLPIWDLPCGQAIQEQLNASTIAGLRSSRIQTLGQYLQAWTQLRSGTIHMWYWAWQIWWGIRLEGMQLEAIDNLFLTIWQSLPSDLLHTLQYQLSCSQANRWKQEWQTIAIIIRGLSWDPGRDKYVLDHRGIITVRAAVDLMHNTTYRNKQWLRFYKLAKGINYDTGSEIEEREWIDHLQKQFGRLWKTELLNRHKEPFWRLIYDAIPTPGRLHLRNVQCVCGHASPDRTHVFWDCPIFQVLIQHLQLKSSANI